MATNGNSGIISYSSLDSFPLSSALTGSVAAASGSTAVIGTATTFITSIGYNGYDLTIPAKGNIGYLFDVANSEWRKIVNIISQTLLIIDKPFSNVLTTETVRYIPQSRVRSLSCTDTGSSGTVDGVSLASNEGGGWQQIDYIDDPITPHLFSNVTVTYSYT